MMEDEIRVPIYFMAGFLESGKSTFLDFTIDQEYFQIEGQTLLILCEEGEVEFDEKKLRRSRTSVEVLNSFDELTPERLVAYDAFYSPERVIIEYNGMWQVRRNAASKRLGNCTAYCHRRCQHIPGLYEQYEIPVCRDGTECRHGSV